MPCVLTVRVKDEEKSLKKDFLIYETFEASQDDPMVVSCVEEVLKEFNSEPDDISVTIKLEIV